MAQQFARKLYTSQAWMQLRFNLIIERGPVCQRCKTLIIDTAKLVGHHIKPITVANINNTNVTLNPANIEIICFDCHSKEHRRFGYKEHNVYVVYGSPLSGKNTLVNQLLNYGDMVMDIDKIAECISGQPLFIKPNNLRFNVFAVRDKMLDMIKTRYGEWHDAYIIGGYPNKQERERLSRDMGAELIYVESTMLECKSRLLGSGKDGREWSEYIDRWWAEYVE